MMVKPILKSMHAWLMIAGLVWNAGVAWSQKKAPNIIIILTDDQGYGDVGFNGCADIPTPGIDRIAQNGVVCTNGYASFAVCGPSRAGLLTGRYQDRFGFSRNPLLAPNDSLMGLPSSEETIAQLLKKAGYRTAILGKWHMGTHPIHHPNVRGFDEFFGFLEGGHRYFPEEWNINDISECKQQYDAYRTKLLRNNKAVEEKEYLTDALSREAVDFIRRNSKQPFFLYLSYNAPHAPLQATEKYLSRFSQIADKRRRTYAAMVSAVDDGVNNLLNALEELNLDKNTLVFFLSDNGGPTKDNASSNKPLRGFKGDFYEGGIRVPFAVQWKGVLPAGTKYDKPVISLDIFATAAALNKLQTRNPLDGINLIPYLTGNNAGLPHEALYWRGNNDKWAIRTNNEKLLVLGNTTERYDIRNDISESVNLHDTNPDPSDALRARIETWKKKLVPPAFLGLMEEKEYNEKHPERFKKNQ
jgi:arylsulfatase A-like enzyme